MLKHKEPGIPARPASRHRVRTVLLTALSLLAVGTLTFAAPAQADDPDEVWEQVQALADSNGALASFEDPNIGPVIIFPKDYSGDIDNLSHPSDWTDSSGNTPTSWPTPTTAKSPNFTAQDITDLETTVRSAIQPDGDQTYTLSLSYDGTSDRVVAHTSAPSSVTDPLSSEYTDQLVIDTDTPTDPLPDCEPAHPHHRQERPVHRGRRQGDQRGRLRTDRPRRRQHLQRLLGAGRSAERRVGQVGHQEAFMIRA